MNMFIFYQSDYAFSLVVVNLWQNQDLSLALRQCPLLLLQEGGDSIWLFNYLWVKSKRDDCQKLVIVYGIHMLLIQGYHLGVAPGSLGVTGVRDWQPFSFLFGLVNTLMLVWHRPALPESGHFSLQELCESSFAEPKRPVNLLLFFLQGKNFHFPKHLQMCLFKALVYRTMRVQWNKRNKLGKLALRNLKPRM